MSPAEALPRMPSLPALRAFESAARHDSFSRAAAELHLTHGAIGHQVRALEASLGVQLFTRVGRGLALTPEGRMLAERVRAAWLDIAAAAQDISRRANAGQLTISVMPSFAARWLVPRLGRFIEQNPDIELVVQTTGQLVDFSREAVDIGLRMGRGDWPDLWCERLFGDSYFPVCAPSFKHGKLPATIGELAGLPLLNSTGEPWLPWFAAAGLDAPEPRGVTYSDSHSLLQAAKEGQGIALARQTMVADDLRQGALLRLFSVSIPSPAEYFLVCPPALLQTGKVQRFRAWLWDEIESQKPG
ncbi:MAG: transcriptional regulator GcvA [Oxalobacteraceae bacterium]